MGNTFLFDLDGTITKSELLPLIGARLGLGEELQALTFQTMQGAIPFKDSFKKRVEMLSEIPVHLVQEIILEAECFPILLDWVKKNRDRSYIVTGNLDIWVRPWLEKHGLKGFTSEAAILDNKVILKKILDKETVLFDLDSSNRTIMVGDGANDSKIMARSNLAIASQMVHSVPPLLLEHANFVIRDEVALCRLLDRL